MCLAPRIKNIQTEANKKFFIYRSSSWCTSYSLSIHRASHMLKTVYLPTNTHSITPKTLPSSIWDLEPHVGHTEFLTTCSQLMHNRASVKGIAAVFGDSAADTSAPEAFKNLSIL
jgi:hypothetical protein